MSCQQNSVMLGHRCWWPKKDCFHINKVPSQSKGSRRYRIPVTYVARILNKNSQHKLYIASDFLKKEKKDHTCPMCSWVFKVIKEKITMFELHEMLNIFQKIILVQYVHEFLPCLPKDFTSTMCSWGKFFSSIFRATMPWTSFVHTYSIKHIAQI